MKCATRLIAALVVAVPALLPAQQRIHVGYRAAPDVSLRIWVPTGLVRVVAWDRDSIDVSGITGKRGKYFGGGSRTHAKLGVESIRANDTLLTGGDFTVRVPRSARVWIKMTIGHIDVDGLGGELDAYVVGGSVAARNITGVANIEAIDATVGVDQSTGALRIRGGKGTVTIRDVAGTATITTVSGAVTVTGPRLPDARVETIGGAITTDTRLAAAGSLELQSHAGTITLHVHRDAMPQLDLASRTGKVSNAVKTSSSKGRVIARSFRGDINVQAVTDIKGMN